MWRGLFVCVVVVSAAQTFAAGAEPLQYDRDIAPLLKRHCVKCHGPAKQEAKLNLAVPNGLIRGGQGGASVVPHDVNASLIWQRVESDEMPPESPLSAEEKARLKQWIVDGTVGLKSDSEADTDHWAFVPLSKSGKPAAGTSENAHGGIDAFLLQELERDGVTYLPEADRFALIRRVSFDLTGLPPTRDAIDEFISDSRPDAYERMVDRYLASPHFGERFGKIWLDVAGYADSNGYFNADSDRPLAYRYRDYVIRSWNADKPYDEFLREQLAGDELSGIVAKMGETKELPEAGAADTQDFDRIIELWEATHYLRNGQDGTGESDGNPDEVRVDRYTVIETAMQNISTGVLGLTVQCAKCHDHKFEPLTQKDYYSLQAVLIPAFPPEQWMKPNERFVYATRPGEMPAWQAKLTAAEAEVTRLEAEIRPWVLANRPHGIVLFTDDFEGSPDGILQRWSHTAPGDDGPGGPVAVNLNSREAPAAIAVNGQLQLIEGGPGGDKWLSTRQAFDWTPDVKGASIQVTFDVIANHVDQSSPAERLGYFLALHDFNDNSEIQGGNILIDGHPSQGSSVNIDYPGSDSSPAGTIGKTGYVPGRNYGVRITNLGDGKYQLQHLVDWLVDEPSIKLKEKDLPNGGFGFEFCCGRSFIIDNVVVESFTPQDGNDPLGAFLKELEVQRQPLEQSTKTKNAIANSKPGKLSWTTSVVDKAPQVHVFERGNYATPGEPVEPSGYAVLQSGAVNPSAADSKTYGRRKEFAEWITSPDSKPAALVARVQANRFWQNLFGTGIVATPDNFGLSGAIPSNRELLDWLAQDFVRSGWSGKHTVRQIIQSAAYRQSSHSESSAIGGNDSSAERRMKVDPDGRKLSRFPIRRLDAESIRDMLLCSSGDFDDRMYGSYVPTSRMGNGETVVREDSPGVTRRSIYLQQKRTQVHSLLQVFDAPSIVFNSTRRARSTMPLQSLSLLNSEFVAARSKHLTEMLEREFPSETIRLQQVFLLTFGRPGTERELLATTEFLRAQTLEYGGQPDSSRRAWTDLCQMLLVGNAALYLE